MKTIVKVFGLLAMVLFSTATLTAQVKIGANSTTITANKNLEIEATNASKVSINKSNGYFYIQNKPLALATDSVVMRYIDGEMHQMAISRLALAIIGTWDLDGDGIPDYLDPDIDGDGILNGVDACPRQYGCTSATTTLNGCPTSSCK